MKTNILKKILLGCGVLLLPASTAFASSDLPPRVMEWLNRGLVALETEDGVFLSWRVLGTDDATIAFDLYRNGDKVNPEPLTGASNYLDHEGGAGDRYRVEVLADGAFVERSEEVDPWPLREASHEDAVNRTRPRVPYLEIPLSPPSDDHMPGDMSVGDLDGDGNYELIFEWEGDTTYLEAIKLDGTRLWRIEGGPNVVKRKLCILVYDFNGDGKAEVVLKTGPGTRDGTGRYLRRGAAAGFDQRTVLERKRGRMVEDPTYITIFKGTTGEELDTVLYWPPIGPKDEIEATWGDDYGHRASSVKAAVLYQKGTFPLMVFARGIYTRIAMGAYQWDGRKLTQVWTFDTEDPDNPEYRAYRGQGNHSVAVADVDGDGSDELIYGACAINNDGTGLYTTGRGHGDSHALGNLMPDRPGLEFFQGHEDNTHGISMRDAATGEIIWEVLDEGDVGRAWAANVDARYRGAEIASTATPNLDSHGNEIDTDYNPFFHPILFDGDLQHELRNRTAIELGPDGRIFSGWYYGATTLHGSKHDANLVADILGDWREEVVFPRSDGKALLVFSTWLPTEHRIHTLMHDPTYRMNVVVQNIGYNQPAYPGFYLPDGPLKPNIRYLRR